jgi:hypothetical protein
MANNQCCGNCNAFLKQGVNGACRAHPPFAILLGVQQAPSVLMGGKTMASPVINGYYPPVSPKNWCREWQPIINDA